jgi:hypothetical protein
MNMFPVGECPKCGKRVDEVVRERVGIQMGTIGPYPGISLRCRHCKALLSVMPDPAVLKEEIVQEMLKALGAKDQRK